MYHQKTYAQMRRVSHIRQHIEQQEETIIHWSIWSCLVIYNGYIYVQPIGNTVVAAVCYDQHQIFAAKTANIIRQGNDNTNLYIGWTTPISRWYPWSLMTMAICLQSCSASTKQKHDGWIAVMGFDTYNRWFILDEVVAVYMTTALVACNIL